jgi:hypothetical protein
MERERPFQVKRLAKPMAFIAIVVLLLFLSKVTVAYTPMPKGAAPLSSDARDKIVVSSINGGVQSVFDEATGGDTAPDLVGVDTWTPSSNTIIVSPEMSASGCTTQYTTSMDIAFTTANQLSAEVKGAVNVTVFDDYSGQKLATDIVTLDFKPGQPASGVANFIITVDEASPLFLVQITFPTSADLAGGLAKQQMPLFEYLLYQAGILVP